MSHTPRSSEDKVDVKREVDEANEVYCFGLYNLHTKLMYSDTYPSAEIAEDHRKLYGYSWIVVAISEFPHASL